MLWIVLGIVVIIVISVAVHLVMNNLRAQPPKMKYSCVRVVSAAGLIIGIICAVFSGGLTWAMFAAHTDRLNFMVALIFGLFFLGGLGDIWAWYSEKIWYDEDSFVVRNFWMVKKKYSYTDITGYYTSDVFYFIMEKKKIPVNTLIEGGWEFMETARRKYAEANNGESIPEASKLPGDIFNGRITGANDIIFVAVLLVAFGVGTLIYVHIPPSGMTSEHFEGTARGVQADGEKLTFYVKGEEAPFIIKDFREYGQSMDMIWDIPAKFTKVFVDAEYVASSNGNPGYYCVYNMSDENGNIYVTFDKAWELEKEKRKGGDIIIGIILIVLVICGTVCVVAGRNPRKYRRLVRLCFKKENIRY